MRVKFYATLRAIAGGKQVDFDLGEKFTVRELIEAVVTTFPLMRHELLDEDGELYRHVHIFINGRDAPYLENGLDTALTSEDDVNIFPAVGGG